MTLVRGADGRPLLCLWDDCERLGHEEHKVVRRDPGKDPLHYVFCSTTHRQLYLNAHRSYGNVEASGPKRSPLGLILP